MIPRRPARAREPGAASTVEGARAGALVSALEAWASCRLLDMRADLARKAAENRHLDLCVDHQAHLSQVELEHARHERAWTSPCSTMPGVQECSPGTRACGPDAPAESSPGAGSR